MCGHIGRLIFRPASWICISLCTYPISNNIHHIQYRIVILATIIQSHKHKTWRRRPLAAAAKRVVASLLAGANPFGTPCFVNMTLQCYCYDYYWILDMKIIMIEYVIHAYKNTYKNTYIHTYIHTCIHTYMHTYIHTYGDRSYGHRWP